MNTWTVVSVCLEPFIKNDPYCMATFKSLVDAIQYVTWVSEYDSEYFAKSSTKWITYIVEGDFINT